MRVIPYILATAGHVDHGKSALVHALTGTDPDRLPEEKARGITIDLGFAHFDLPAPSSGDVFRVGVVDVPGHEDFVKTMVAGVGSIDAALLVVAADDGWMPQTEEHLQVLTYLGVRHAVVALSKADLVESDASVRKQIVEKLQGTPLAGAPIVATAAPAGRGIDELKAALARTLGGVPPQRDVGKPRLSVDRAFALRGIGTVVTGTLTGGTLSRGQQVVIQPAGAPARIRTLQCYNNEIKQAVPGLRVALNLPDLQPGDNGHGADCVGRGDVVTLADLGRPSDTLDVMLEVSPRAAQSRPLKEATLVRFHHGSGNTPAFVYFAEGPSLQPGQRSAAQLRLESPAFTFACDHFILRDWTQQQTIAGGIVLDPSATRRGFRTEQRRAFLEARARQPDDPTTFARTALDRDGAVPRRELLVRSRFSADQVADALAKLSGEGRVVLRGECAIAARWWADLRARALDAIEQTHRSSPQAPGLRLPDLRQAISKQMGRAEVFDALVSELCRKECVRSGVAIRRASHRPTLPPKLAAAGDALRATLAARRLDPLARRDLAPDPLAQQALRFLVQTGEAVEIGPDIVVASEHYNAAIQTLTGFLSRHGPATVSELKQALNTSRRIMVPLAEKLDRDGITQRHGDRRVLRKQG